MVMQQQGWRKNVSMVSKPVVLSQGCFYHTTDLSAIHRKQVMKRMSTNPSLRIGKTLLRRKLACFPSIPFFLLKWKNPAPAEIHCSSKWIKNSSSNKGESDWSHQRLELHIWGWTKPGFSWDRSSMLNNCRLFTQNLHNKRWPDRHYLWCTVPTWSGRVSCLLELH